MVDIKGKDHYITHYGRTSFDCGIDQIVETGNSHCKKPEYARIEVCIEIELKKIVF